MLDILKGICILMVVLTHVSTIPVHTKKIILYPFTILPAVPMFIMMNAYSLSLAEARLEQCSGRKRTITDWFEKRFFLRKLSRFLLPYAIAITVFFFALVLLRHPKYLLFKTIWTIIWQGGRGPGGYYVLIILQILILFPFLRYGFDHNSFWMGIFMFLFHISYECLSRYVWGISSSVFNRLVFKFFSQLALGILLYRYEESLRRSALPIIAIVIGSFYIINSFYFGYETVVTFTDINRNLFASLFSFGTLVYLLQLEPLAEKYSIFMKPICYIGKASFHIMLTQMVYYYYARMFSFEARIGSLPLIILTDLGITLSVGCLFYCMETVIRKQLSVIIH